MYALGIDFGTNSCRALLLDLEDGREVATAVFPYPSGQLGILTSSDPHLARQNPRDYLSGVASTVTQVLAQAQKIEAWLFPPNKSLDSELILRVPP